MPLSSIFGQRPSLLALVVANLIPLLGALFLGWSLGAIVLLYWLENIIVGIYNFVRIISLGSGAGQRMAAVATGLFFIVHYGIFCTVHGAFVFTLFGDDLDHGSIRNTLLGAIALFLSHGFSLVSDFSNRDSRSVANVSKQMAAPYPRMVILHVAIIFGAMGIVAAGTPLFLVLILIVGKTLLDLSLSLALNERT